MAWPEGASPRKLAAHTNLAAVPFLDAAAIIQTGTLDLAPLAAISGLVMAQLAVSTTMFLMFFRLQQIGGPTYLSQIGYVAAAVGVLIGVAWLGEILSDQCLGRGRGCGAGHIAVDAVSPAPGPQPKFLMRSLPCARRPGIWSAGTGLLNR